MLLLVDGGHAVSQTEGETATGNSSFLDCSRRGECPPEQLDVQSFAVSATKGRIHKAITGGGKLKGTSDLLEVKRPD